MAADKSASAAQARGTARSCTFLLGAFRFGSTLSRLFSLVLPLRVHFCSFAQPLTRRRSAECRCASHCEMRAACRTAWNYSNRPHSSGWVTRTMAPAVAMPSPDPADPISHRKRHAVCNRLLGETGRRTMSLTLGSLEPISSGVIHAALHVFPCYLLSIRRSLPP